MNKTPVNIAWRYLSFDARRFWPHLLGCVVASGLIALLQIVTSASLAQSTLAIKGELPSEGLGLDFGACIALALKGTAAANMGSAKDFVFPIAWLTWQLVISFTISRFVLNVKGKDSFLEFVQGGRLWAWYGAKLIFCTLLVTSFYMALGVISFICSIVYAGGGLSSEAQITFWNLIASEVGTGEGLLFLCNAWLVSLGLAYLQFTLSLLTRVTPIFIGTMAYLVLSGIYLFPFLAGNLSQYQRVIALEYQGFNMALIAWLAAVICLVSSLLLFWLIKKRDLGFLTS